MNVRRLNLAMAVYLMFGLMFPAVLAANAQAEGDSRDEGVPELGNHRFIPSPLVSSPFIQTYLTNNLGMAKANDVQTPPIYIGDEPVAGLEGNISTVFLSLKYQLALKRWIALWGEVGLKGIFGTGVQTLLAEGVGTSFDFNFGWVFSFHRGDRTELAGTLELANRSVTSISVFNLVSDIVEGTNLGLSHQTPVLNGQAGLRWSWAISPLVGATLNGSVGHGDSVDRFKGSEWIFHGGLAMSFDLDEYDLPLGVVLTGTAGSLGGAETTSRLTVWEAGGSISYIGRESFVVSLDFSRANVPAHGIVETYHVNWFGGSLRYYF